MNCLGEGFIQYIHRDPVFEKRLKTLREEGGTSLFAVKKTEEIVSRLLINGRENSHRIGRLTRKGELRIKRGIKYDLGNGYRLVCARNGCHLILLYIGAHDECSRWLERNKNLEFIIDECGGAMETLKIRMSEVDPVEESDPSDEYEEQLMKKIDDQVLRTIFCGLVNT